MWEISLVSKKNISDKQNNKILKSQRDGLPLDKKNKNVYISNASMLKRKEEWKLTKQIDRKHKACVRSFRWSEIEIM